MPFIKFPEWAPDQPAFQNNSSDTITNVLPRTEDSYGPIGGLSTVLTALTARCQGAIGLRDSAGNGNNISGDATKLYLYTAGASSWTDVSKAGGYAISPDEQWNFTLYGDSALACNISDPIQSRDLVAGGNFADLSSGAPKCRHMAVSRDFLILGNTTDAVNGAKPQRVWWSAIGDDTNFPTLGTAAASSVQSDAQDVVGDHGWLTGIVANVGPADAILLYERAVFRAMYIGSPDVWGFYPAYGIRGCIAAGSAQLTEIGIIYLSVDGFELYNGTQQIPIGFQKVDKTFYKDVDQNYLDRITSVIDPINKLYFVAYPSLAAAAGTGIPDTILVCNYMLGSEVTETPGRWAKITGVSVEILWRSVTLGYNVDTADTTGFNVDTAPFGPDSRFWTGGALDVLSAFDTTHTMAVFTGSNLAPTLDTSEFQPLRGRLSYLDMVLPITDGGTPTVTDYTRNRIQDSSTAGQPSSMNSDGFCFLRAAGRHHRLRMTLPGGSSFTHIQGIDIPDTEIRDAGGR